MIRFTLPFLVGLAALPAAPSWQDAPADLIFRDYPFDQWIAANDHGTMRMNLRITPARLSHHQRLQSTVFAIIDGKEIAKRATGGELIFLEQITDRQGRRYKSHGKLTLRDAAEGVRNTELEYEQEMLILPGDYRVDIAVIHTASGDHGLVQKTFRVDALSDEPLPAASRDLPPLEYLEPADAPDRWYIPSLTGRLNLPLETGKAVRVELLVNSTQTEVAVSSTRVRDINMSALIPAMKVLTQIDVRNGTMNLSMLDLERRRVSFSQDAIHELDWPKLREALAGGNPNVIDVQSLANHKQSADFFLSQVSRRVESAAPEDPLLVLVILSAPMSFSHDVQLHPIETVRGANCVAFYIRYQPIPDFQSMHRRAITARNRGGDADGPGGFGRPGQDIPVPRPSLADDYLEHTLKPLKPRRFNVTSPADFRRAVAAILHDVARATEQTTNRFPTP